MEEKKSNTKIYNIDANNKVLGRLATEIATILRGKNSVNFKPYKGGDVEVVVKNVDKLKFTGNKMNTKKYYRYSGYIGGVKETVLKDLFAKNPQEVLRKAVFGMLPKNTLRRQIIKKLKFEE